MTTLAVEPTAYATAASQISTVASGVGAALGTLSGGLGGSNGMGGSDDAGVNWANSYDKAAHDAVNAATSAVQATSSLAALLHATGSNYAHAETGATLGGGIEAPFPQAPVAVSPAMPSVPSASGAGSGDEPFGWSLVSGLVGYLWPNGHQDRLHSADTAWKGAATQLRTSTGFVSAAVGAINAQQSPESGAAATACGDVKGNIDELASAFSEIGDSCAEYASHLDNAHHEILSELKSLLAQTVAIEAVSALVGVFTAGIGELAGQAVEAGRLAAAAAKIRSIIQALIAAARTVAAAIGRVAGRVGEILAKLEPIARAAAQRVAVTANKAIDATGAAGRAAVERSGAALNAVKAPAATAAKTVAKGAPLNFATSAGIEAGKEGIESLADGQNHMDPTKIIAQGAIGTVTSPASKAVAARALPTKIASGAKKEATVRGLARKGVGIGVSGGLNAAQQGVHEAVSPGTAEAVKGTSVVTAAEAVPDALVNLPSAAEDLERKISENLGGPSSPDGGR